MVVVLLTMTAVAFVVGTRAPNVVLITLLHITTLHLLYMYTRSVYTCILWSILEGHAHIRRLPLYRKGDRMQSVPYHMPYPAYTRRRLYVCLHEMLDEINNVNIRAYIYYIYNNTTARQRVNRSYSLIQKAIRLCPNTYGKPRPKDEMSANLVADGNSNSVYIYMCTAEHSTAHTHTQYICISTTRTLPCPEVKDLVCLVWLNVTAADAAAAVLGCCCRCRC